MKKNLMIVVAALVVVVGLVVVLVLGDNKSSKGPNVPGSFEPVDACELFTEAEAKELLGTDTIQGTDNEPANTPDASVSTCSYSNNATAINDVRTATILIRTPLTEVGEASNQSAFGNNKPTGAESVSGYGSDAYYMPATGQLHILKGNVWIIATNGGTQPSQNTRADAKRVADKVID